VPAEPTPAAPRPNHREAQAEGERLVRNAEGELERGRLAARDLLRDELLSQAVQIAVRAAKSSSPGAIAA